MKTDEMIIARTHAELLNELLQTNYKGYMKCGHRLPDGKLLWMIRLNNTASKEGWTNTLVNSDLISEQYEGDNPNYVNNAGKPDFEHFRVVFDIDEESGHRVYLFRGVFDFDGKNSEPNNNFWKKVSDEYIFPTMKK